MYRALHTSRTGMKAYQDKLDVISNNLANSQTDGYKRIDTDFVGLLKDSIEGHGAALTEKSMEGLTLGTGVRMNDSFRVFDQGILVQDENPMSLALEGEGFFGLENASGELLLTRNGQFQISQDGKLVNESGYRVALEDEESLEGWASEQIEITSAGELFVIEEDGKKKSMGCLKLYGVLSREILTDAGEGLFYTEEDGLERIDSDESCGTVVKQGFIEKSNVDIGKEMVDMMISQRAYQMNARAVQSTDEMWSLINNMKR